MCLLFPIVRSNHTSSSILSHSCLHSQGQLPRTRFVPTGRYWWSLATPLFISPTLQLFYSNHGESNCFLRFGFITIALCNVFLFLKDVSLGNTNHYEKYNAWREGDTSLDWFGAETSQGTYKNQKAEGTPMAWTSNQHSNVGYQPLNT